MTQPPRLEAFKVTDPLCELVPSPASRAWMDAFQDRHAYRCLPLAIANVHGWDVLCPVAIEISWNGGPELKDLTVRNLEPLPKNLTLDHFARSNFSRGIVTLHTNYLFRTPPGWNLMASGPFNNPKPGISPLTGIIETDWLPYPFTMNWQMLGPGKVRFERGEPFCTVMPIPKHYLESWDVVVHDMNDDPVLHAEQDTFRKDRDAFMARLNAKEPAAVKQAWQRHYFVGRYPDGTTVENHTNKVRLSMPRSGAGTKPLYAKTEAGSESAARLLAERNAGITDTRPYVETRTEPEKTIDLPPERSSPASEEETTETKAVAMQETLSDRGEALALKVLAKANGAGKKGISQRLSEFAAKRLLAKIEKERARKATSEASGLSCPMHNGKQHSPDNIPPDMTRRVPKNIAQTQTEKNTAGRARLDKGVLTPSRDTVNLALDVDPSSLDFIFEPGFLSLEQSKLLAETAKSLSQRQHVEGIKNPYWQGRILFYADIAREAPEAAALMQDAQNRITKRLQEFYAQKAPIYADTTQLVQWREGMFMAPHADNAHPDGSPHDVPWRDFASIVYLNDDYEGGELYFSALDKVIKPVTGMLVAFTGGWHHEHAVLKVTKGLRLTMPAFYTLDATKKDLTFYK